jgi:diguanylate cyclase (GGDEF)-like protein
MRQERSNNASRTLEARAAELEEESQRDPLTGLHNRAWFDGQLADWFGQATRTGMALSVMLADIDALHQINQTYGHVAGDKVIFSVAACLKQQLRPRDLVARHLGATFSVLLPGAPERAARAVAERLRASVAAAGHGVALAHALHVTISVGSVTLERDGFATRQQILEAAARALAAAKGEGATRVGNRVVSLLDKAGDCLDRSPPPV